MAITELSPTEPRHPADEPRPPHLRVVADPQITRTGPPPVDPSERSYVRKVVAAWLIGIPVFGTLVTIALLAVGDLGVGGSIAVGAFGGFWMAPLAGVVGIGLWASEQSHR